MKREDVNMDKSFREKLEAYSADPPRHIWDGVQEEMAALRKRRRIAFYSRIAAAAVIVLAFLAGWYFSEKSNEVLPEAVQNKEIQNENKPSKLQNEPLPETSPEKTDELKPQEKNVVPGNDAPKEKNEIRKELLAQEKEEKQSSEKEDRFIASAGRVKLNRISRIHPSLRENASDRLRSRKTKSAYPALSETEKNIIAENSEMIKDESMVNRGWKMGINISPSYSSQVSNHANSYARNMTYQSSEGNTTIGGGFSVQYKTGKKWSVESGIYYAQNGQKSGNSQNLLSFADERSNDFAAAPQFGDNAHFNTSVQVTNNEMAMNSTAGVIEFDRIPKGVVMAANPEESFAFSNTLLTNGEFSQVFDFVEIPLYMRYLLIESKIDVEIMGGVHAGLVVGNNAFMENEYGVQNIGQTKDISPLNLSGAVGVGLNYALGKRLSLAVEPRFNYFLNSINSNPAVDYRPYRVGVHTGLYYDF